MRQALFGFLIALLPVYFVYRYSQSRQIETEMGNIHPSSKQKKVDFEGTSLLDEYLSTVTYMLRKASRNEMPAAEVTPLLFTLTNDLQRIVPQLRQQLEEHSNRPGDPDTTFAVDYLNQVDGVIARIPRVVSIFEKYPKGNKELDSMATDIIAEFVQLKQNLHNVLALLNQPPSPNPF